MSVHWIIFIKYIAAILLLCFVIFLPAYLARQTGKDKTDMLCIRIGSWLFVWTGIGWLWSLFKSAKK